MSRPKGSRNRNTAIIEGNIDERIKATEAEIERLTAALKTHKSELKKLAKAKIIAEREAAERKAAEDKQKILAAVEASGKSVDEVLNLLK